MTSYIDAWRDILGVLPDGMAILDDERDHHSYRENREEPSCAWALHAVRSVLDISPRPGESAHDQIDRIVDAAETFFGDDVEGLRALTGFRIALDIASNAQERFRVNTGYDGCGDHWDRESRLPARLTPKDVAADLDCADITESDICYAIALARFRMFGTLTQRQIRRKRPVRLRHCADCGKPLPLDAPTQRRYCATCSTPAAYTRRSRARMA